jgi:hypothetical protein
MLRPYKTDFNSSRGIFDGEARQGYGGGAGEPEGLKICARRAGDHPLGVRGKLGRSMLRPYKFTLLIIQGETWFQRMW